MSPPVKCGSLMIAIKDTPLYPQIGPIVTIHQGEYVIFLRIAPSSSSQFVEVLMCTGAVGWVFSNEFQEMP